MGDIIYFPWMGRIFWFGRYFPWQSFSLANEFSFNWTYVTSMVSWGMTSWWRDAGGYLAFACRNWSAYDINLVNLWQSGSGSSVQYASSGFIETMEFIAPSFAEWEQNKKLLVPYELPSANTSIKVHVKRDRGGYEEVKTISSVDWIGYHVAEISYSGKWRTIQFKFELISTSTTETPKLYTNITNLSETCGNKS